MATATIPSNRYTQVALKLRFLTPFRTHGALRSETVNGTADAAWMFARGYGRLPRDWARTLTARRDVIDYVIYSYATPIAWHDKEAGWVVPDVRYSVTTSRHQGTVRAALTYLDLDYAE